MIVFHYLLKVLAEPEHFFHAELYSNKNTNLMNFKAIVNLFSCGKKILILYENKKSVIT